MNVNPVILYGPPAGGKTMLSRFLCFTHNKVFVPVINNDSPLKHLDSIFSNVEYTPKVLIIDEIKDLDFIHKTFIPELKKFNLSNDLLLICCTQHTIESIKEYFDRSGFECPTFHCNYNHNTNKK